MRLLGVLRDFMVTWANPRQIEQKYGKWVVPFKVY
jgi:hypothetical protein